MGSDDQINPAFGHAADGILLLRRRAEAGEHFHIDRETGKTFHGGDVVLSSQDSGGDQNGALFAVKHALHGGAEGHLGLAEAHVAAEQAVHGARGLHIALDFGDATELVVGLGIFEGLLKLDLPGGVGGEGVPREALALGVELNQSGSQVLDRLFGAGLGLFPLLASQLVEPDRRVLAAADILADLVELGDRNIEYVGALIVDFDIVLDYAVRLDGFDASVASDAVVGVDHQVARIQVGEGVELLPVGDRFGRGAAAGLLGGGLSLGQDGEL